MATAVQDLLDEQLVQEDVLEPGGPGAGRGRPSALVVPVQGSGHVIGIDFGHTHVTVALADRSGTVIAEQRTQIDVDTHARAALDIAAGVATRLITVAHVPHSDVRCVAAGIPAPIDSANKAIRSATIMSGWVGLSPEQELSDLLGWRVVIANDADMGAQGELRFGAAKGMRDLIYVKLSDGLGASLVFNGSPYGGSTGLAGEIGHTQVSGVEGPWCRCGNRGCLETLVSASFVHDLLRDSHLPAGDSAFPLREAVNHPAVSRFITESGRTLGRALADACNWLNPSGIILGGELGTAGAPLVDGVRESIVRYAQPSTADAVQIRSASLGLRSEVLGAVAVAIRQAGYHSDAVAGGPHAQGQALHVV